MNPISRKNPFRIQWNAFYYQYDLLHVARGLMQHPRTNWISYWSPTQLICRPIQHTLTEEDYYDKMSRQLANGHDGHFNSIQEESAEDVILTRLSVIHANDFMRG
jgi:hypothetical protein